MKHSTLTHQAQRGATLIVVLFMLLLITIVGIIGIRVAITSLNIATNSQVGQLLLQTGDTPTNQFLNVSNYNDLTVLSGAIGKAIEENKVAPGKEIIFCYKPTSNLKLGSALDTTVLVPPAKGDPADSKATIDSTQTNRSGFCDLEADYGSARQAVVTQVAVRIPTDAITDANPGSTLARDTDVSLQSNTSKGKVEARVRVTSTAIMPAYSTENLATVQSECIGSSSTVGYINDNIDDAVSGKRTVADCLRSYGIPVNTQVQEIDLRKRDIQITAP
ncbi:MULTISPECIES: pilus assembly PilX family protein [Acinetobacter]|uniref:Type IV pilus assembly protein PilX n=2 Tax=Acinetobacter tandoii TaxID=202954 RepID=R9AQS8_9GAMM|nr:MULTISPECIES: hypothetical protein [Acinetobacter]AUX86050.1 hypothetical protein C3F34_08290 [Acinetobacter sp. ACNIH2]EOR02436.1 hypothetical protein I593_03704 [Acinetobacter tandoii DSM 14970 = CIP 107469]KAB1856678.1 hypothetical protein F4W09_06740 [Acinetobacter tandoii]